MAGYVLLDDEPAQATPPKQKGFVLLDDGAASNDLPTPTRVTRSTAKDVGMGILRGAKDVIDTGAQGLASGFDKLFGTNEGERVRGMNEAGKQEFDQGYGGSAAASLGRVGGNVAATLPVGGFLGYGMRAAAPMFGAAAPAVSSFGNAIASGGLTTGNTLPAAANMAARVAGGAVSGGAAAGLIDPNSAGTGAVIGAALPPALKAAQKLGSLGTGAARQLIGRTTGTSPETLSAAFAAGQTGNQTFLNNMRGQGSFDDVVDAARNGLEQMRLDRGQQYRSGMADISADKTVLDFAPIDNALKRVQELGTYKGVQTNKNAAGVVDDITQKVKEWRSLDPAEYHTPEGLDALKRAIGDIRDATQFGTPGRKAADSVYNAVKNEISSQAPTYSKVMGDYSRASAELSEIEKALSLSDKASKDTAIRKLQSLMRNNAQTNYGNRLSLAQQLEQKGGVELTPAIAGQALNTWTPRGMAGVAQLGGMGVGAFFNPATLALAPFTSPRLMGEAAYRAGLLSSGASNAASKATGLLSNPAVDEMLLGRGLLSTLPVAISANQTARQ